MALTIKLFPGGNTGQGFYSCFSGVMDDKERLLLLKGGPGVGKSSMMKRFARALDAAGLDYELFPCSSDPDSLDAVCAPSLGLCMMDATAPHAYDPELPGARETLVALGDYLDESRLRRDCARIGALSREIGERFRRAYCCLAAAAQMQRAACGAAPDVRRALALSEGLQHAYLPDTPECTAQRRALFGAAYTPHGHVRLLDSLPRQRTVVLSAAFGQSADLPLRVLRDRALQRGHDAIALRDPICPERLAHLYLPKLRLLFTTDELKDPDERIDLQPLFPTPPADAQADEAAFSLMTARAVGELRAAMALHDELETYYTAAMDFDRWQERLELILADVLPR